MKRTRANYSECIFIIIKPQTRFTSTSSVVLDYDEAGHVCDIDIDYASQKRDLAHLSEGLETYLLSESALAKDWLSPEEDEAWKDL